MIFFEFLSFLQMPFCFSFSLLFMGFVFIFFTLKLGDRVLVDAIYLLRTKRLLLLACLYILSRMPATDTARFAHNLYVKQTFCN